MAAVAAVGPLYFGRGMMMMLKMKNTKGYKTDKVLQQIIEECRVVQTGFPFRFNLSQVPSYVPFNFPLFFVFPSLFLLSFVFPFFPYFFFLFFLFFLFFFFLVACDATLHPAMSFPRSVGWSPFYSTAPAHLHATRVAVYPSLFFFSLSLSLSSHRTRGLHANKCYQ